MIDKKLNAAGDVDVSTGGAELVTGNDASVQSLKIAMQSFRGDWLLDLRDGIPYFGRIFVKNANIGSLQQIYRDHALAQPSVASVDSLEVVFTPTNTLRRLDLAMNVTFSNSALSQPVNVSLTGLP